MKRIKISKLFGKINRNIKNRNSNVQGIQRTESDHVKAFNWKQIVNKVPTVKRKEIIEDSASYKTIGIEKLVLPTKIPQKIQKRSVSATNATTRLKSNLMLFQSKNFDSIKPLNLKRCATKV